MKPLFLHDCERCKFLGSVTDRDSYVPGKWIDLYVCMKGTLGPTLIGRYGHDGFEYASCPAVMVDDSRKDTMGVAKILAGLAGLKE